MDIRSSIMFHCNSLNVIKSSTAFILWSLAQVMAEKCFTDCGDHSFGVLFRLPFWLVVLIHGMVLCSSTPFCAQFEMPQPVQHFANLPCLHMVYYPYIYTISYGISRLCHVCSCSRILPGLSPSTSLGRSWVASSPFERNF